MLAHDVDHPLVQEEAPDVLTVHPGENNVKARASFQNKQKLNPHHTRGITSKRVTSGGTLPHGLVPGQLSSEDNRSSGNHWRHVRFDFAWESNPQTSARHAKHNAN